MLELNIDSFLQGKPVRNLSGHERGERARQFYQLDELDRQDGEILFIIPEEVDAIATSFFLGMFAESVKEFQTNEEFFDHYKFKASPEVFRQILQGIKRVRAKRGSAFSH